MAEFAKVHSRIWRKQWSEDAKYLALYILTCEHRTIEGLYRLPKSYICADLSWTPKRLAKPFAELLREGFIEYDEKANIILITKALKYQRPENPNQVKHAINDIASLPPSPLLERFQRFAKQFAEGFGKQLPEGFGKQLPEGFGKHTETETEAETELELPPPSPPTGGPSRERDAGCGLPAHFAEFWQAYPRKVGKAAALKAWAKAKITNGLGETIVAAVERQRTWPQWTRDGGRYIPHPATWLNQGRWEDEPDTRGGPVRPGTVSKSFEGTDEYPI